MVETTRPVAAPVAAPAALWRRLRRFLRSPKGFLLLALIALTVLAAPSTGMAAAVPDLLLAVAAAAVVEVACVRVAQGRWLLPSSALLSGLIVALVLSAQQPWYVEAAAGALASASKQLLRAGRSHVFNPAAVGLLAVYWLFGAGHSWWGALPGLPLPFALVVLAVGAIVAERANKLPAALSFCGVYTALFTLAALHGQAAFVADLFRTPFVQMALFFGLLMVTDPPTSPVPFPPQVLFGAFVAMVSFALYMVTRGLYFLLVALLIANALYAAWQYVASASRRRAPVRIVSATPEQRALGLVLPGAVVVLVLVLAAGVALTRRSAATSAGSAAAGSAAPAAAQQPASAGGEAPGVAAAQPAASGQSAGSQQARTANAMSALSFHDTYTGTRSQQQDGSGAGIVDITADASGGRAVRLVIHLALASGGRRGRVQTNQATLLDGSGATLCRGRVTLLDDQSFNAECQVVGDTGGQRLEIDGTITGGSDTQIQGELDVTPLQ